MCLVSIIIPFFNNEQYIKDAIDSIRFQKYKNIEIILVDDASKDSSVTIVQESMKLDKRIKLFQHIENKGCPRAVKTGIENSSGEYIFLAGADDISFNDRINKCLNVFKDNINVGIVVSNATIIDKFSNKVDEDYIISKAVNNRTIAMEQFKRNYCLGATMALKRNNEILLKAHMLEEIEDYQIAIEYLLSGYDIFVVDSFLIKYRIHDNNCSNNKSQLAKKLTSGLKRYDSTEIMNMLLLRGYSRKQALTTIAIFELFRKNQNCCYHLLIEALEEKCYEEKEDFELYFYLGVCEFIRGNLSESYKNFCSAYMLNCNEATLLNNLGLLHYLFYKDKIKSKVLIEKSLKLIPNYLDAKKNLESIANGNFDNIRLTERLLDKCIIKRNKYILD
ncbi:glycosyltransferase [Pelosinus fermentans]|uniref:Glycosyl transferase family 2 n=1 Tax=Pelosinus fermentans JBW45 TaxID=1192197 RepID=I9NP61_9FIRM|nr:glycosyltransferase [Pelosinus fermentans]AJQ26092.1 glycosyl transferase family 2 [Pelosinus fermentans JBW45]